MILAKPLNPGIYFPLIVFAKAHNVCLTPDAEPMFTVHCLVYV